MTLFGGAAGPGKSEALFWDALIFALEHPGVTCSLMRRTFPELEAKLIKTSLEKMPPGIGRYNDAKHRWTLDCGPELPPSYIEFHHCEREKDVYKHQSAEWQYLGVDESTTFPGQMLEFLMTRVRSTIPGVKPRVRFCTNPGNIGHGWHRDYFGIGNPLTPPMVTFRPPKKPTDKYDPPSRCFIPAVIFDNPALINNDPGYLARLEALPEAKKRMFLYGEWGGYDGQFFTEFREDLHVVKPFPIPRHWKRYRSVDWGFQKPFSCHWYAVDERGHAFVYRELYKAGLRDKEQARAIADASGDEVYEFTVGDPNMCHVGAKDTGVTAQQHYHAAGIPLFPGSNKRVAGWTEVRNWLAVDKKDPNQVPFLRVFDTCTDLIRELRDALHDAGNPEDVDTDCSDHAIDDLRYWAMSRPSPAGPLQKPDEADRLDAQSRSEWEAVKKMQQDAAAAARGDRAILHGLNDF